ncbi:MAG: TolC family outer membrane protein [Gammaproteobacteria bacterium]|nr:TolC family outer membrane protein [Gammaproteobacteria bacterium]
MKNKIALIVVLGALQSSTVNAESLQNAVFKAIANYPEIRVAISRKSAQEQLLRQAESGYYPSVDLVAGVGNENSDNRYTRAIGATDYVNLTRREESFVVTQNLFQGFSTSNDIKRNQAKVTAENDRLHDVTEQTALQAAETYLDVLRQQALLDISNSSLKLHEDLFNKVQSRSQSGVGRKADIDQAVGRVALARANLIADQANLERANTKYQRIIGVMPVNLLPPPDEDASIPQDLNTLVQKTLETNPLLKAAQAEVDAAHALRQSSKSPYYPSLDLVFAQSRGENLDGIEGVEKDYSLMLKMRYNLFNGGYDSARVNEAGYRVNESKDELDNIRRQVIETTRLAWNAFQAVNQQIPYLQQHVTAAQNTRAAYTDQFKIGQRTLLDLLDSENELYQAQRKLISAKYDRQISIYRILANMGGFVEIFQAKK